MTFTEFGPNSRANVPEHNRLRGLDQGDPHPQYVRVDALDAELSTRVFSLEQRGTEDAVFAAVGAVTGSVAFAQAFAAAPIVQVTVLVGSNLDILVNLQGVTTTGFTFRAFNKDGTNVSGTATLHWTAREVDG